MSNSSSYMQLLADVCVIAEKYGYGIIVAGFTPPQINLLVTKHQEKVRQAESYDDCIKLFNNALSMMGGTVESFITKEVDRQALFAAYSQWRDKFLQGEQL